MTDESRRLYEAVKKWDWDAIDKFVEDGGDINASLVSEGSEAGYTALHFAVIAGERDHVQKLIEEYDADVNSVAEDGATLLQIAYLREEFSLGDILLEHGADINAEFNQQVHDKYNINFLTGFTDKFGDTMTLIAYAVDNNYKKMTQYLISRKPDLGMRDTDNRTLLMRAVREDDWNSTWDLADAMKDNPDLLNAKDNDGWNAVHHLLSKTEARKILYYIHDLKNFEEKQANLAEALIEAGADVNAKINGDPDTLLVNKAAHRHSSGVLSKVLRLDVPLSVEARPLRIVMSPVDLEKHGDLFYRFDDLAEDYERRTMCIYSILTNYTLRRAFGFFVPEEEIKLMDFWVEYDSNYKEMVTDFEEEFIDGRLKKQLICYGDKSITCYDVAVKALDAKSLKQLVKDDEFVEVFQELYDKNWISLDFYDSNRLHKVISNKIKKAYERKELIEEFERVSGWRGGFFIPLPYGVILKIIKYLRNEDLQELVGAICDDVDEDELLFMVAAAIRDLKSQGLM